MSQDQLLRRMLDRNVDYYIRLLDQMKTSKAIWNWSAAFGGPFWFGFRKMYKEGLLAVLAVFIGYFAGRFWSPLAFVPFMIFGAVGNTAYYQSMTKKMAVLRSLAKEEQEAYIAKNGGTDIGMGVGLAVLAVVSCVVISSLMQ